MDQDAVAFLNGAEQGANAGQLAVVILNTFHGPADSFAGGHRRHHQQNPLVPNDRLDVIPEDHLVVGVGFRGHHGDVGVVVNSGDVGLGKLLRQISAYNAGAFQADNHIHRRCGIGFANSSAVSFAFYNKI